MSSRITASLGSPASLIGFSCNAFQQLSGVNVMSSLGPYIFEVSIGMSRYDALLVAGGLQVFYFLSSIIPWFIVDKVGRRRLFILGSAGMGSCMLLSAIFVGIGTTNLGYAAAVSLMKSWKLQSADCRLGRFNTSSRPSFTLVRNQRYTS